MLTFEHDKAVALLDSTVAGLPAQDLHKIRLVHILSQKGEGIMGHDPSLSS